MATKRISLNELRTLVRKLIKEEQYSGINNKLDRYMNKALSQSPRYEDVDSISQADSVRDYIPDKDLIHCMCAIYEIEDFMIRLWYGFSDWGSEYDGDGGFHILEIQAPALYPYDFFGVYYSDTPSYVLSKHPNQEDISHLLSKETKKKLGDALWELEDKVKEDAHEDRTAAEYYEYLSRNSYSWPYNG